MVKLLNRPPLEGGKERSGMLSGRLVQIGPGCAFESVSGGWISLLCAVFAGRGCWWRRSFSFLPSHFGPGKFSELMQVSGLGLEVFV
jgi:hypothetical protein